MTPNRQYISASKVAQFLYCPFTFELSAAGYEPQEPYIPAVATGAAFHDAFRYMWLGMPAEDAAEAAIAATELASGYRITDAERQAILRRLHALPEWALRAKAVEVKIEMPIPTEGEEIIITGFLDAIMPDRVVELKAVSRHKGELPHTYRIQAQIYMYATGLPETTFLMIDPKGELRQYDVERLNRKVVEEMLIYFARSMQQQYKPPSGLTNFACDKCAFAYACPFVQTLKQTQTL